MSGCATPRGKRGLFQSFYPSFRRRSSTFVSASLSALSAASIEESNQSPLHSRFCFWLKSSVTTTQHPHHLLPRSSKLLSQEDLVFAGVHRGRLTGLAVTSSAWAIIHHRQHSFRASYRSGVVASVSLCPMTSTVLFGLCHLQGMDG